MVDVVGHAPIDGTVDAATVGVGIAVALSKTAWRYLRKSGEISLSQMGTDFLNGTVIPPFVLMIGAVFSMRALEYQRTASPVSMSIAGAIGLLFVLNELRK